MSINFPNSPSDGDIFVDTVTGNRYKYSSAYSAWVSSPNPTLATISQVKRQLISDGNMQTVFDGIPAEVNNAVNVEWTSGIFFTANDSLYGNIQTTLSYSTAQMNSFIANAKTQTI